MTNIDKQHEIVKTSLFHFVNTHITAADLSVVDEIVLNYVISILEEASEDPNFDVEGKLFIDFGFYFIFFMIQSDDFLRFCWDDVRLFSGFLSNWHRKSVRMAVWVGQSDVQWQEKWKYSDSVWEKVNFLLFTCSSKH